jgi:hypothetical protein
VISFTARIISTSKEQRAQLGLKKKNVKGSIKFCQSLIEVYVSLAVLCSSYRETLLFKKFTLFKWVLEYTVITLVSLLSLFR